MTYTVIGHGWGHGVGMGQYGALGFAQHGVSAGPILRHYYQGTHIGSVPRSARRHRERVLLTAAAHASIACACRLSVRDLVTGHRALLRPGRYRVEPRAHGGLRVRDRVSDRPVVRDLSTQVNLGPATSSPLRLDNRATNGYVHAHWRGRLRLLRSGSSVLVIDVVRLESYVRGVVPSEVPASWPNAALGAQAVASRSYAVATRRPDAAFDTAADSGQQYGPIEHEQPATTAAVRRTAGRVVLFGRSVATTYFSSSSGGRTATPRAGFGSRVSIPYLRSVRDPFDAANGLNPNHTWRVVRGGPGMARALGVVPGRFDSVRYPESRRVREIRFRSGAVALDGHTIAARLGLRSTYFRIVRVRLSAPPRVRSGRAVRLAGSIWPRFAGRVTVLRRPRGAGWRPAFRLPVHGDGTFRRGLRLHRTAEFRLDLGGFARSPAIRVRVVR